MREKKCVCGGGEGVVERKERSKAWCGGIGGIQEMTGWGHHHTTEAEYHPEVMGVYEASGLET